MCVCARISVMILSNALSLSLPLYLKKNTTETALGNLFLLKLSNVCSVSLMLKQMIRNEFILTSCVCVCVHISVTQISTHAHDVGMNAFRIICFIIFMKQNKR